MTPGAGSHASQEVDPLWAGVINVGGWSLFGAAALLVVFIVGVMATGQELPVPAEQALADPRVPVVLFMIAAIGELLLAPAALGLYGALKEAGRTRMVFAAAFMLGASLLFLVSRGPILSLAQVGGSFAAATDEPVRAAYVALASFGIELQNTYSTMALVLLSAASILAGTAMLRTRLVGRSMGYVAIAAGAFSIFTPFIIMAGGPEAVGFIGLALGGVWQLVVGLRLARLEVPDRIVGAGTPG